MLFSIWVPLACLGTLLWPFYKEWTKEQAEARKACTNWLSAKLLIVMSLLRICLRWLIRPCQKVWAKIRATTSDDMEAEKKPLLEQTPRELSTNTQYRMEKALGAILRRMAIPVHTTWIKIQSTSASIHTATDSNIMDWGKKSLFGGESILCRMKRWVIVGWWILPKSMKWVQILAIGRSAFDSEAKSLLEEFEYVLFTPYPSMKGWRVIQEHWFGRWPGRTIRYDPRCSRSDE